MDDAFDIYLRVREKEGRLYADDVARNLPVVPADHPLRAEWRARAASCDRLVCYLARTQQHRNVLELGCGNGWLANRIAGGVNAHVVGLDRNRAELRQAHRLFADRQELSWIVTDIFAAPFSGHLFDAIVLASAIQYFADLTRLLQALIPLLAMGGEIHILDSPLYSTEELPAARDRSRKYYEKLGYPEMAALYHHHTSEVFAAHNPEWLYFPRKGRAVIDRAYSENRGDPSQDSPFPWICLRPDR